MPNLRPSAAFSLIELLVCLALLAIAASLAVPAFNQLLRNQQAQVAAEQLHALLLYARGEAATRGRPVAVRAARADGWAGPLEVRAGTELLRQQAGQAQVDAEAPRAAIEFRADGSMGGTARGDFCISVCPRGSQASCRHLRVQGSGLVKLPAGGRCGA